LLTFAAQFEEQLSVFRQAGVVIRKIAETNQLKLNKAVPAGHK
jgi:hypothetical protein